MAGVAPAPARVCPRPRRCPVLPGTATWHQPRGAELRQPGTATPLGQGPAGTAGQSQAARCPGHRCSLGAGKALAGIAWGTGGWGQALSWAGGAGAMRHRSSVPVPRGAGWDPLVPHPFPGRGSACSPLPRVPSLHTEMVPQALGRRCPAPTPPDPGGDTGARARPGTS